jgi:cytochrome c
MPSVDIPAVGAPPSWKLMAADDKAAVASFLASMGERMPPRDPAKVAKGKGIVTARCASCHLFEGQGDDSDQGLAPEL